MGDIAGDIEAAIHAALADFATKVLPAEWYGKEHDWVNRFVFNHLIQSCRSGAMLFDPGQIGIDVGVPQPPGHGYAKAATRRDVVIWGKPGSSCWSLGGEAVHHPIAILEWKVHRRGYRNHQVSRERLWLSRYAESQPAVVLYAVEIEAVHQPARMRVTRFRDTTEEAEWLVR